MLLTVPGGLETIEENRLNMEDMELSIDCHRHDDIKTEPPWSPAIHVDTGNVIIFNRAYVHIVEFIRVYMYMVEKLND